MEDILDPKSDKKESRELQNMSNLGDSLAQSNTNQLSNLRLIENLKGNCYEFKTTEIDLTLHKWGSGGIQAQS